MSSSISLLYNAESSHDRIFIIPYPHDIHLIVVLCWVVPLHYLQHTPYSHSSLSLDIIISHSTTSTTVPRHVPPSPSSSWVDVDSFVSCLMFSTSKVKGCSFVCGFVDCYDNLRVLQQLTHHHQHCNNSDVSAEQGAVDRLPSTIVVPLWIKENTEFGAFFGPKKEQNRRGKEYETSLVGFLESIW